MANHLTPSLLPLFSGPQVFLRLGKDGPTYKVSQALICAQSPYFAAIFTRKSSLKQGETQEAILTETYGIVSDSSVKALIQYLYRGKVAFTLKLAPEDEIWKAIEVARLGDMVGIHSICVDMAAHIKAVLLRGTSTSTAGTQSSSVAYTIDHNDGILSKHITSGHIVAATQLPPKNAVRKIIVAATVEGYLRCKKFKSKFETDAEEVPAYAADLIGAVKVVLASLKREVGRESGVSFKDPVTEKMLPLKRL